LHLALRKRLRDRSEALSLERCSIVWREPLAEQIAKLRRGWIGTTGKRWRFDSLEQLADPVAHHRTGRADRIGASDIGKHPEHDPRRGFRTEATD
jgi:hypothetical protein